MKEKLEVRKKILLPRGPDKISDFTMYLGMHMPGITQNYIYLSFLLFGIALYLPFLQINEDLPIQGYNCLAGGWKYFSDHKLLGISWASNFFLLKSLFSIERGKSSANPWLYFFVFLLSLYSLYHLKNNSLDVLNKEQSIQILNGAYVWSAALFSGFIAHSKALYS